MTDAPEPELPWDARILASVDLGVDETLIAERLRMTPTERVEAMRAAVVFAHALRDAMKRMITDFNRVILALAAEGVRYVIIGGVAMVAHGSSRTTVDLDLCYARSDDDIARLARALAPLTPRLRDFPPELPFFWDAQSVRSGLNFTLTTDAGDVDLMGEVPGLGPYERAAEGAVRVELFGQPVDLLSLDALERSKRAAGRAKDLFDLGEIAKIRARR